MEIALPQEIDPRLGESLDVLVFQILNPVNQYLAGDATNLHIDVSPCSFITPLIATPLAVLHNRYFEQSKQIEVKCQDGSPFSPYSKLIHFPQGFRPETVAPDRYEEVLSKYGKKTYIPIINFPAKVDSESNHLRESILQTVHDLLRKQLDISAMLQSAVFYLIDELVNNIQDHSHTDRGFIFAQYYPGQQHLDVCIADDGIGLLGSYLANGESAINSHSEAVVAAIKGISTKNEISRGFGISTSINMLVNGMGGSFILMSGNANIVKTSKQTDVNEFPESMYWQGTLVGLRIPFTDGDFNYGDYV